jgi:hypothetical protein
MKKLVFKNKILPENWDGIRVILVPYPLTFDPILPECWDRYEVVSGGYGGDLPPIWQRSWSDMAGLSARYCPTLGPILPYLQPDTSPLSARYRGSPRRIRGGSGGYTPPPYPSVSASVHLTISKTAPKGGDSR